MSAHRKLERELQLEYYRLLAAIQYDRNAAPHNLKTNQITEELSQIISHEEIESVKDVAKQRFMKDFKLCTTKSSLEKMLNRLDLPQPEAIN